MPRRITQMSRIFPPPAIIALINLWESYQVELQGSYSVGRLQDFVTYHRKTGLLRALTTALATPLPCIALIVLADVLPLAPPTDGLGRQGVAYWVRTYFSVTVITITSLSQFYHGSSKLRIRPLSAALVTLAVVTVTVTFIFGLHVVVAFPTPFLYQFTSGFWQFLLFTSMWTLWKGTIRSDAEARADMQRFIWCWLAQVAMIVVYPVFSYVFSTLSNQYQVWFSCFLPTWKLALKIWASYGVFRVEDSAPVFVVFTVDVFHALFLSCAMQSSASAGSGALVVTMVIDFCQSCVAINDVRRICFRLQQLGKAMDAMEVQDGIISKPDTTTATRISLFRAGDIVSTSHVIREHASIAGSRHQRAIHTTPTTELAAAKPSGEWSPSANQRTQMARVYVVTEPHNVSQGDAEAIKTHPPATTTAALSPLDEKKLAYVRNTLQLLHVVEFYVLIEFTEVLVATVYSIYLVIMSQLPNRVFYSQLRTMNRAQWEAAVGHVVLYAMLELLSFVALELVLRWMLGFSPLRQLAFALRKHWLLVQSLLCLWVFFVVEMSLEHLGTDYSFKFRWIHSDNVSHG